MEDLVHCEHCGTYVTPSEDGEPQGCGEFECPFGQAAQDGDDPQELDFSE